MKKTAVAEQHALLHAFRKIPVIICCWLLSHGAIAQSAFQESRQPVDPVASYLEKNKNTTLVQHYYQFPGVGNLARLVKIAIILEGPDNFPEFSQTDIARMQQEFKSGINQVENMGMQMKNGMSAEHAKHAYESNYRTSPSSDHSSEQIQPKLSVPGN